MRYAALGLVALVISCGGDDLTLPNEGQPAELAVVRGNGQNGTVGEPLADSLVVRVRDRFGNPVAGIEVAWTAEVGGSVDPATSATDADGRAGTQRTLGPQPGTYTTVASVAALPDDPVVFTTTGVAAKLFIVTQPSPQAVLGTALERQPVVQLLDADGEPVARAGVVVTVQIAAGGGTLGGTTSVASDASGLAAFTDLSIRGDPGIRTLLFAADAFASAASAPIAVGIGAAASIAVADGDGQSATVNTAVATPPAVVLRDAAGNPVSGLPVSYRVGAGGGSITGATAVTDANGIARVGSWTLGRTAGSNTLRAEVEGLELAGSPVTVTATGLPGPLDAGRSTIEASPATIAASSGGVTATITVTATDAFGNPLAGLPVSLSATGSGNVLTQPAQPTNASGVATGRLAATSAGSRVVSATVNGQGLTATASVNVTAAAPAAGSSSASVPASGTAGVPTVAEIRLADEFGNPAADARGAIGVTVAGANAGRDVEVEDAGGGLYRASYTPTAAGVDQVTVTVSGAPVVGSPFSSAVAPGPASPDASTAELSRTPGIFTNITAVVTARDAQGNPVGRGGEVVTMRVNSGSVLLLQDNGNGTYSRTVFTFGADFTIDIEMNGVPARLSLVVLLQALAARRQGLILPRPHANFSALALVVKLVDTLS